MPERLRLGSIKVLLGAALSTLALGQAWAAPVCQQLPLSMPLKFIGPNLAPAISPDLGTTKADMALDTAQPRMRLTYRVASRMKLQILRPFFDLEDGKGTTVDLPMTMFGLPTKSRFELERRADEDVAWDAVIGSDALLRTKDIEISLHDGYFRELSTSPPCERVNLAYWDPEAVQVPLTRLAGDGIAHFPVKLNDVTLDAIFSTTEARSMITPAAAARAGLADRPGQGVQASFKRIDIGAEQVRDGFIDIVEHKRQADIVLGNEFLRTHRVLISRLQSKMYLSYLSGPPFPAAGTIPYWLEREAIDGNGAAQYIVWQRVKAGARTVDKRPAQAWLRAAGLASDPLASGELGRQARQDGRYEESQALLRKALNVNVQNPFLSLELYLSTRQGGDAVKAEQELRTVFKATSSMTWPRPLLAFYLGEIGANDVLQAAGKEPERSGERVCSANLFLAEYYEAAGQPDQARPYRTAHEKACVPVPATKA